MQPLFTPTTIETAPEAARETLQKIGKAYGFVPNLMATFANAPAVLHGYLAMDEHFNKTGFSQDERQLILLAASVENECGYCTAAHSTILKGMMKVPAEIVSAVRQGQRLPDARKEALVSTVREIVARRGRLQPKTLDAFFAAGYTRQQAMELLLGVALKTVSNYLDHFSAAPLDSQFAAEK